MKQKNIILAFVGIAAAVVTIGIIGYTSNNSAKDVMPSETTSADVNKNTTSENKFANLKGDDFDEAFIADMLAHHEGAVNMSEQAQAVTNREEIRTLAGTITNVQSMEMIEMREWQKEWGYEVTNSGGHMSHGGDGMDMAGDMTEMMNKLQGLEGDAYDKEFLTQMIIHHQQAIDMAQYAEANAKHGEIKELAQNVITTQRAEIAQMQQWQREWGY